MKENYNEQDKRIDRTLRLLGSATPPAGMEDRIGARLARARVSNKSASLFQPAAVRFRRGGGGDGLRGDRRGQREPFTAHIARRSGPASSWIRAAGRGSGLCCACCAAASYFAAAGSASLGAADGKWPRRDLLSGEEASGNCGAEDAACAAIGFLRGVNRCPGSRQPLCTPLADYVGLFRAGARLRGGCLQGVLSCGKGVGPSQCFLACSGLRLLSRRSSREIRRQFRLRAALCMSMWWCATPAGMWFMA